LLKSYPEENGLNKGLKIICPGGEQKKIVLPLFINYVGPIYKQKGKIMSANINHPSVIKFLSDLTSNIVSSISIENYFGMSEESKTALNYAVFKIIKNSTDKRVNIGETEFKALLVALWKKNEDAENYEVAAILDGVIKNYDSIKEICKPIKTKKTPKIDKKPNG
jgi:hypothetical protein